MQSEPLKYGQFYHVYNCGIDSCNLFREAENYEHFHKFSNADRSADAVRFEAHKMENC